MAVVTRPVGVFPCVQSISSRAAASKNGRVLKRIWHTVKTQVATIAVSLSLFTTVRLPRETFKYGVAPYLLVYSFWLMIVGLPVILLELVVGQLSHQDPVGSWRAVPILRGIGHLKLLTSFLCGVYYIINIALSSAYFIWIAKGSFPLKDCTKLHLTPHGYENKMNASECFNSTFLAPFLEHPQYLGIMAILIFILWFFVPILLCKLRKSFIPSLIVLAPLIIIIAIILSAFLSNFNTLAKALVTYDNWTEFMQPHIWHSSLVQALLTTQIGGGYLISAGGSVYRHSDVRWTSTFVTITSLLSAWLSVFLWESIGGEGQKDTSFIAILVLIYQSCVTEKRTKVWPLLAYALIILSGVVTILTLLFPIYDKLQRLVGEHWRLFATASSAVGTAISVCILAKGIDLSATIDELVLPVLTVFTTAVEVVGFVFIYGWYQLVVDIEFLTTSKLPCLWMLGWWCTPIFLITTTGWWLRTVLKTSWEQGLTLWPLFGVFIGILVIMVIMAAIAVAKEEQFNLFSKITSAFKPSRLWGPEEPLARYVWMSQKYANETPGYETEVNSEQNVNYYSEIIFNKDNHSIINEDKKKAHETYQRMFNDYNVTGNISKGVSFKSEKVVSKPATKLQINVGEKRNIADEKFRSPNICVAKAELGGALNCKCNRHFTLNVPQLKTSELTTSL